ncbi:MAG: hypothetical protein R3E84_11175 [Pseudomonadales bacterium]
MSMWTAIVLIVALGVGGGVMREFARSRGRRAAEADDDAPAVAVAEFEALRQRVEVLERIVTDEGFDLKRELARLERTG